VGKIESNISDLFEPQLSQKANKINFGNRIGKNDMPHQTTPRVFTLQRPHRSTAVKWAQTSVYIIRLAGPLCTSTILL